MNRAKIFQTQEEFQFSGIFSTMLNLLLSAARCLTGNSTIDVWQGHCTKKWGFPLSISSVNVTKPQETADLVTFTEEILMEDFIFCAVGRKYIAAFQYLQNQNYKSRLIFSQKLTNLLTIIFSVLPSKAILQLTFSWK